MDIDSFRYGGFDICESASNKLADSQNYLTKLQKSLEHASQNIPKNCTVIDLMVKTSTLLGNEPTVLSNLIKYYSELVNACNDILRKYEPDRIVIDTKTVELLENLDDSQSSSRLVAENVISSIPTSTYTSVTSIQTPNVNPKPIEDITTYDSSLPPES